ncbi:catabolite gene activator protein [Aquimarina atlantica]|uniref:Catabolite gene activator protein n=1 Tax=Aquimarina atlantica TaxID=1317122 RepID=A0A023BQB3_9FLAO|nr:Crp/Fnr family transcriptional regulator [Aquimarina atlantica]EZH71883.1 catabolite gene activator protein [Aquimarina atlantica]
MPYTLLRENIDKHIQFSDAEFETYSSFFYPKTISKKEYLLRQGDICRFEGFVTKGCFRVYTIDNDGNENVLYFAVEDWWVTDIDSFTNQAPALLSIQSLEDSEVLLINKKDKEQLYQQMPKVEKLFRIMTQKTLVSLQRRLIRNHCYTADERYLHFIKTYPKIAQKLTNLQIAAYLGISHEFVSKIRKKIASKK